MARMARLVVPHYPHHVTQRGSRRQPTFFSPGDYDDYMTLIAQAKAAASVEIWAYCLMPNHVHLVVVPAHPDSLTLLFRDAHLRYTRRINFREGWRGHLWQERFHSFVMDERHLLATVRYTELNPVRAGLCSRPDEWLWSSVHAHLCGTDDLLVNVAPMLRRISNWRSYLDCPEPVAGLDIVRSHSRTGRPAGDETVIRELEVLTGRSLRKKRPGRKAGVESTVPG